MPHEGDGFAIFSHDEVLEASDGDEGMVERIVCQNSMETLLFELNSFDFKTNIEVASGVMISAIQKALKADESISHPRVMSNFMKSLFTIMLTMAAEKNDMSMNEFIDEIMNGGSLVDALFDLDEDDIDELFA